MAYSRPSGEKNDVTEIDLLEVARAIWKKRLGCLTVFIIRTFQKAYKGFIFLSNIKFIFARYLLLLYNNSVHD